MYLKICLFTGKDEFGCLEDFTSLYQFFSPIATWKQEKPVLLNRSCVMKSLDYVIVKSFFNT